MKANFVQQFADQKAVREIRRHQAAIDFGLTEADCIGAEIDVSKGVQMCAAVVYAPMPSDMSRPPPVASPEARTSKDTLVQETAQPPTQRP